MAKAKDRSPPISPLMSTVAIGPARVLSKAAQTAAEVNGKLGRNSGEIGSAKIVGGTHSGLPNIGHYAMRSSGVAFTKLCFFNSTAYPTLFEQTSRAQQGRGPPNNFPGPLRRHMATLTIPISFLDSNSIPPLGCRPSQAQGERSQTDAVSRAQAGDRDAFSELYARHKKHVFSICMRMVRDFSLAEDLTQETFLQVHRKLATFRGDSIFSTWLHRLAVNTALMHLRKRALAVVSLDHLMENVPEERAGRSFGTRDLTQAGVIDRLAIYRAVATMAPGYRNVFLLHDVQGFDHGEIASMLACSCGTTKSQLHKARRVLRGALTSQAGSGDVASAYLVKDSFLARPKTKKLSGLTKSRGGPVPCAHSTISPLAT